MKKGVSKLMTLFIAVCVTLSGFAMSSCCVSEHVYSDFWTYDTQYHYRAAECKHGDEITDKEEHDGDICSVCGYVDESLVTKGVGVNSDGYVYADRPNWYEEDEKPDRYIRRRIWQTCGKRLLFERYAHCIAERYRES